MMHEPGWRAAVLTRFYYFTGESLKVDESANMPTLMKCSRCNYVSSQQICKACILLEGLNKGLPRLGIGKTSRINRILNENKLKEGCTENDNCCKNTANNTNPTCCKSK